MNSQSTGSSVWGNKVSGFLGIRATIRVHLIVNAQPFQQGRYFMIFYPCSCDFNTSYDRLTSGLSAPSLVALTQLPRAEVDLCSQSEVIMDIPYIHLNTHMNLLSGEGSWGRLYLCCYIPFATGSGGTQSAPFQMYFSLHDIDLVCPTKPITVAQMANVIPRKGKKVEETKIQEGPVSSFLNKVTQATTYLSQIPILSSYMQPLSWCSAIIANSAAVFGWSKPRNEQMITRINNVMGQYQQNCDGVENAFSLGLFTTNKVQIMPSLGGTQIDEMSIDFIKQQPAFYTNFQFTTSNLSGDLLKVLNTAPFYFNSGAVGTSNNGIILTPLCALANVFQYYRGSVIFTIKMAKTRYHTGRLLIAFLPGSDSVDTSGNKTLANPGALSQTNYLHREFLDIQDCCEFEFEVPYVSLQPYNLISNSYGKVAIYCLNALQCPSTCATTINLMVEVRAGKDFEFFQPTPPVYFPSTTYAQMDSEAMPRKKLELGSSQTYVDEIPSQLCVGEKVLSVKQLVSRGYWSDAALTIAAFRPFILGSLPKQNGIYAPLDYYSYFASAYTFSRGGMIIRSYSPNSGAWCLSMDIDPSSAITQSYVRDIGMTNNVEADPTKFNSVYVPQYTLTHGRLNTPDQGSLQANPPFRSNLIIRKSTLASSSTAPNLYIMRQGADDTQFGYFVGFPPMTLRPKTDFA